MAEPKDNTGSDGSSEASVPKKLGRPAKANRPPYNLKASLIMALRTVFFRHPLQAQVAKQFRVEKPKILKDGSTSHRPAVWYTCQLCKQDFKRPEVQLDHITPVVSIEKGFEGYDKYIERLFCDPKNIMLTCKPCHRAKTLVEIKERAKWRAIRKQRGEEE